MHLWAFRPDLWKAELWIGRILYYFSSFTLASKIPEPSELTIFIISSISIIRCKLGRKTVQDLSTVAKCGTRRQYYVDAHHEWHHYYQITSFGEPQLCLKHGANSYPVTMIYLHFTLIPTSSSGLETFPLKDPKKKKPCQSKPHWVSAAPSMVVWSTFRRCQVSQLPQPTTYS